MVDKNDQIVWSAIYTAFGKGQVFSNSKIENLFRLPGQYHDPESELHFNYHRYYNSKFGRYLTTDPSHALQPESGEIPFILFKMIIYPQELNRYSYAINNPINLIDSNGLSTEDCWISCQLTYEEKENLIKSTITDSGCNNARHPGMCQVTHLLYLKILLEQAKKEKKQCINDCFNCTN